MLRRDPPPRAEDKDQPYMVRPGIMTLYLSDLQSVVQLLSERCERVSIYAGDARADSIADLADATDAELGSVAIYGHSPSVVLSISSTDCAVVAKSKEDADARQLVDDVSAVLQVHRSKSKERRASTIFPAAGLLMLVSGAVLVVRAVRDWGSLSLATVMPYFTVPTGEVVSVDWVTDALTAICKDAGVKRMTPHGLRHTFATVSLESGVHPKVVSDWLGHASSAQTMETYSHVMPAHAASESERVGLALFG